MKRAGLVIRAAGPGVTIQDAGRFGYARYGVTPAGPMDPGTRSRDSLGTYLPLTFRDTSGTLPDR